MKLRHARAVAVCAVALVALTGARGSGGGGCDGGSSSSSSGSHRDSDDGTDSTSGGSTGVTTGGASGGNSALRDVKIKECGFDAAGKNMTATLTVENDSALTDYEYDITVAFKGTAGDTGSATATAGTATVTDFPVPSGEKAETEATTPYTGTGDGSEVTRCEVRRAGRTSTG
ncbi:hypothetical protein [Streptomyces sp. Ru87]|uniref:hypothetical protein n=1 Tax=Streptomyces sp. Ru87 TaxID=2044307 RepID=UPI000BF67B1E|nr:hypothetical protein [Streptomyces sp. Ru87]PGH47486.1 hypothetical protein CRI70_28245 [Streptomyces sp. Ru87]